MVIVFDSKSDEFNLSNKDKKRHIVTTQIEHVSVLSCFKFLEKKGYKVDYLTDKKNCLIKIN